MGFSKIDPTRQERPEGRNCLLVYGYEQKDLLILDGLREETGISDLIQIEEERAGHPLQALISDVDGNLPYDAALPGPAIVFHAVSESELNSFLAGYRETGLKRALLAVTTPTSILWRFGDLLNELARERKKLEP